MDSTASAVMTALIEAGDIDTVYRDVYLDRARTVLAPVLSLEEFHRLEQDRAALAELPLTITRALDNANWSLVKQLSERAQTLKHAIDDKGGLLQTARSIYDVRDVRLDPFSPGLEPFTRIAKRELPTLRKRTLELLATLERADVAWNDFYGARRRAFQERPQTGAELETDATSSPADAVASARQALKAGDMKRLEGLADALIATGTPSASVVSHAATVRASSDRGRAASGTSASRLFQRDARPGTAPGPDVASPGTPDGARLASPVRMDAVVGRARTQRRRPTAAAVRISRGSSGRGGDVRDPPARELGRRTVSAEPRRRGRPRRGLPRSRRRSDTAGVGAREEPPTPGSPRLAAHRHRAGAARAWCPHRRTGARTRPARVPPGVHPAGRLRSDR